MKTQRKNSRTTLHEANRRWKWMAGATAATAAGATASQASLVTINLTNNFISAIAGNHLSADLTGDGHPDLTIANAAYFYYRGYTSQGGSLRDRWSAEVVLNGVYARAFHSYDGFPSTHLILGSRTRRGGTTSSAPSLTGSIPIFFKDLHINGGAPTSGSLQLTAFAAGEIHLDRLTYTSNSPVEGLSRAVPDQGSSLLLLATGAGGVLALRRWRSEQERS
jgi:hypothetical protein